VEKGYDKNCHDVLQYLTDLTLTLSSTAYTIPAQYLVVSDYNFYGKDFSCFIPIFNLKSVSGPVILGYPWLRTFYTSLNYETNTVSFAINKLN
jgi:hypothetical protein